MNSPRTLRTSSPLSMNPPLNHRVHPVQLHLQGFSTGFYAEKLRDPPLVLCNKQFGCCLIQFSFRLCCVSMQLRHLLLEMPFQLRCSTIDLGRSKSTSCHSNSCSFHLDSLSCCGHLSLGFRLNPKPQKCMCMFNVLAFRFQPERTY